MQEHNITIGDKIKVLRVKRGLSIEEVSQKAGLSASLIREIEGHAVSPPLGYLISLAEALRVTVGELLGDSADSPFCIVRSDGRKTVSRFGSIDGKPGGYSYESLGCKKQNRQMEPFFVTLTPAEPLSVEANQHVGEEFIFVLAGQVEVKLADHVDILNPGDSIYYDSTLPHVVSCHSATPATILAVIYAKKEMLIL